MSMGYCNGVHILSRPFDYGLALLLRKDAALRYGVIRKTSILSSYGLTAFPVKFRMEGQYPPFGLMQQPSSSDPIT